MNNEAIIAAAEAWFDAYRVLNDCLNLEMPVHSSILQTYQVACMDLRDVVAERRRAEGDPNAVTQAAMEEARMMIERRRADGQTE